MRANKKKNFLKHLNNKYMNTNWNTVNRYNLQSLIMLNTKDFKINNWLLSSYKEFIDSEKLTFIQFCRNIASTLY